MDNKSKRKIILINKKFQYRIILGFILVNVLILIIFGIGLYIFLNSEIDSNLNSAHVTYRNIKDMLFPIILTLSIINILVSSILIFVFVMMASFRIAGPLYRFNEALKDMGNKNLKPGTSLRKSDQLYECSITLTSTVEILANDFSEINNKMNDIKDIVSKEKKKGSLQNKVEELEGIIKQYEI